MPSPNHQKYQSRRLNVQDVEAWRSLRREGVERYPTAFLPNIEELQAVTVQQDQERLEKGNIFGIWDQDRMIGVAGLVCFDIYRLAHRAECGPFYITPDYHGRGAAAALMDRIADEARSRHVKLLELWVTADNDRAQRFYFKYGFKQIAVISKAAQLNGQLVDDLFLRFEL